MDKEQKFAVIKRKTRQRMLFSLITMGLYFSFVLNYSESGRRVVASLGTDAIPGPVVMFAGLIILFIALELVFLLVNSDRRSS